MWPDSLGIDVSRESLEKLEIYHALLLKWQKAINLVSNKTIDEAWIRHFADTVQIESNVPRETKILADLGSGAGFPGMILAILRPEIDVHLIEADERKCEFLRTVSRETDVDITVHISRIEDAYNLVSPDIITARALADLTTLLEYAWPWVKQNPALECVFLKGAQVDEELSVSRESFSFEHEKITSRTDPQGCVLKLRNISKI